MTQPPPSALDRPHSHLSGEVNLLAFLPLYSIGIVLALFMSIIGCALYYFGLYFIIIAPLLLCFMLAVFHRFIIKLSECGNPVLAAITGGLLGLVYLLGFYYINCILMLQLYGAQYWPRLGPIVSAIRWQIENQGIKV